ncbi:GtrA family protein [Sphingomonas sp. GCM10030256]|uniref:GtrA family protein n=1 Tax=Sphingomonas sp. GCM10030256 TaxID=3273427 RepID=UPI003611E278
MSEVPILDAPGAKPSALSIGGRPVRYLAAAVLNTGFGLAIYPLLLWSSAWLTEHYMVALVIAQAVSLLFAFTTYRLGVFRASGDTARQFGLFSSFYLFNYVANWAALPLLVEVGGISPIVAQLGFALVLMVGSYFWHSRVTFRNRGT